MTSILFRLDANADVGAGHLMRCRALALAARSAGAAVQFAGRIDDRFSSLLRTDGFAVDLIEADDVSKTLQFARSSTWVVLDGYDFDARYQRAVRDAGHRLLVIDDIAHQEFYDADIILNQNPSASGLRYVLSDGARTLLGPKFALLRSDFRAYRGWVRSTPPAARKILVLFGGSDADDLTSWAATAFLQALAGVDLTVVAGPANRHVSHLSKLAGKGVRLLVDPPNLAQIMTESDLAVSAAGSTALEFAYLGLPALLVSVSTNQEPGAAALHDHEAAQYLGPFQSVTVSALIDAARALMDDPTRRERMKERALQLVDGQGTARVVAAMGVTPYSIRVRPAQRDDILATWRISNDSTVRANSFNRAGIPLRDHVEWFQRRIDSASTSFWLVEVDGVIAGQVRYERKDSGLAEVHIGFASEAQGRGAGSAALEQTLRQASDALGVTRIQAVVREGNPASRRAFEKAGYQLTATATVHGAPCLIMEREAGKEKATCVQ